MKPRGLFLGAAGVLGLIALILVFALGWGLKQAVEHAQSATLVPPGAVGQPEAMATPVLTVQPTPTLLAVLGAPAPSLEVVTATVSARTGELVVIFKARQVVGDYLYEAPVLNVGQVSLAATAASLKNARLALLNLAASGEAQASLTFEQVSAKGAGELVFNPESQPESVVAPKVALTVNWTGAKK